MELHQKTHFESKPVMKQEPMLQPPVITSNQQQPIVFYNQPPEHAHAPMNFYTESMSLNSSKANGGGLAVQPKKEYPIMNQLLTGLSMNHGNQSLLQPVKPFVCGTCSNAFSKKKELDRHVMTIHTNIKQFKCEKCPKMFNRKDKLLRHQKTHLVQTGVFNCSLCPAVFIRQQMLEVHSKLHQISNGDHLSNHLTTGQPVFSGSSTNNSALHVPTLPLITQELNLQSPMQDQQPNNFYPMNLSVSKNSDNEPMNLSNDKQEQTIPKIKFEPLTKMSIDSDEERDDRLQIVEDPVVIKRSPSMLNFKTSAEVVQSGLNSNLEQQFSTNEIKQKFGETLKNVSEISFSMTSRIPELDKMETLKDLPMEILNND